MDEKFSRSLDPHNTDGYTFLLKPEEQHLYEADYENVTTFRRPKRFAPWLFHVVALIAYTVLFLAAWAKLPVQKNCHEDMIFSPVRESITWWKRPSNNNDGVKSPFNGPPSVESDAAWSKLLKNSNIRISEETLRKMNRSSIKLQDGSGMYGAGLQVHHHLHCLKSVRQMFYRDYYGIPDEPAQWSHLNHCLEDIRLAIMCNADISLLTWDWLPNYRRPWANFFIDGECVDWDRLDAWAGEHSFSLFDQESVVHPELGLSYPFDANGKPDTDPRIRPQATDLLALKQGTNPKGNWGPGL